MTGVRWRLTTILVAGFLLALPASVQALPQAGSQDQQRDLADEYLRRMVGVWEADATVSDLDALGELLTENATYEHPYAAIKIQGRRAILEVMSKFLGASRSPRVSGVEVLAGSNVIVLGFDLAMEIRDGDAWTPIERRQLVVLQISEGLITGISDHW